jgi:hypothetical protein
VVSLLLNGKPLPATLLGNTLYYFTVQVDEREVVPQQWTVTVGATVVASGNGTALTFAPIQSGLHSVDVIALGEGGVPQEGMFSFNATPRGSGTIEVGVNWDRISYQSGDTLRARIFVTDPEGLPPTSVSWVLFRNNTRVASGSSQTISQAAAHDGIYRLRVDALDAYQQPLSCESTIFVTGNFEAQFSIPPEAPSNSLIYLGALYTEEVTGDGGTATVLPYQLASQTQEFYLLPGTTHYTFDLDPAQNTVDDEVVVRTKAGNWALVGYPGGLNGESVGYDYQPVTVIPAPADLKVRMTLDAFNVHGATYAAFNFRVRIKCYAQASQDIWRYEACAFSVHPGGEAARQRRWAALFTEIETVVDADTDLNRYGTGATPVTYTTPEVTSIPQMSLSASGEPNPVTTSTGLFFTDSNLYATYESEGLAEIDAKAVCALEDVRPFYMSLQMPAATPIVQRITRLKGRLVVYVSNGAVSQGSTVKVTIQTGAGPVEYSVPVDVSVYNASSTVFQRVGSIAIDLSDYQFSRNGVVADFVLNDSTLVWETDTGAFWITNQGQDWEIAVSTESSSGTCVPVPAWGTSAIFASSFSRAVKFDGACYSNPTRVSVFDAEAAADVRAISGCEDTACGPVGMYCYDAVDVPAEKVQVPQPLDFPAPLIAYGTNPSRCFHNPVFTTEVAKTTFFPTTADTTAITADSTIFTADVTGIMVASGSIVVDLLSYSNADLCGTPQLYNECNGASDIIVVYPFATSPHSFVSYGSVCYGLVGTLADYGTRTVTLAGSVTPVASCADVICTGSDASGSSFAYFDNETDQQVNVKFDRLDLGIAHYGIAPAKIDPGTNNLSGGQRFVIFSAKPRVLLIGSVPGTGKFKFVVGLFGFTKRLIVQKQSGQQTKYEMGPGHVSQIVDVQAGDAVLLDIGNPFGVLTGRTRGLKTNVTWEPVVILPRKYDEFTFDFSGSSSLIAAGFCGLTNRLAYTLYDSLPVDTSTDSVVNPDNIVTVQSSGSAELVLMRVRAIGDLPPQLPGGLAWYAGEVLSSPVTFRFYTGREAQGAHGEMDVWINSDGSFPGFLNAGQYRVLVSGTSSYRRASTLTDTTRGALRVASGTNSTHLPNVYVGDGGQLITVDSNGSFVIYQGGLFERTVVDPGLSYRIIPAEQVFNLDAVWSTDLQQPWLTDGGKAWDLA